MNIKRFIAGLMSVCVIGAGLPSVGGKTADNAVITVSAADEYTEGKYEQLTYKNYGDYIKITGYDGAAESVVIPDEIDGVPVTCIGWMAFRDCKNLTKITISDRITSIGESAFYGCESLTEITIPNSVTIIDSYAFYKCTGLTEITIPDSVTSIGYMAFSFTAWLEAKQSDDPLVIVNGILIDGTTCSRDVVIPDGVASIGERAFYKCSALTRITISNSVTNIGKSAFSGCESLTEITIPDSVTSIEDLTFYNCERLTKITIPSSVTSIGKYAFEGCSDLTSIEIPDSVTSIEYTAFNNCSSLTAINLSENNSNYLDINGVLFNKNKTELIAYPAGKNETEYIIPDKVTYIGGCAFKNCTGLTKITIPDSVTIIYGSAFNGCTGLTKITIPDSVTSIYQSAFEGCTGLTEITIPDSVTSIGSEAFKYCTSLKEITIPESVTSLGSGAFYGCTELTEITFYNPICKITDNGITINDSATIYGYEYSTASAYAKKHNRKMVGWQRPKLNYTITESETDKSNIAKSNSVEAEINYSTTGYATLIDIFGSVDKLQECKDSKGTIYAIGGNKNSITLFSENIDTKPVTIENDGFTFGAAAIDENDNLYVLWGYDISEDIIKEEQGKKTENLVIMKYDLNGNILGRCGIPITTSRAQYPFVVGNASMAVKDNVIGCFFNMQWIKSGGLNHQGSEFAAIDKNTMELITFDTWEGSHSFGVSLIATDYGFAGIQKGDVNDTARGINFNSYLVLNNKVESNYLAENGCTVLFSASGQYGTNENQIDGNATYIHMGGLAKSATTYAVVGKSERIYSSMEYYGKSGLRTYNYDVFLKIADQTLAKTALDLAGEERVDVETGETADYNIVWLTECNETEKAGEVKVVTLADGSYCVLWEKFVNDKFDSIRYVITDECGNILRHETGIYGARLSDTSVQPIVDGYTLKWAVADDRRHRINFYTVDLNEFSPVPIKEEPDENLKSLKYRIGYDSVEIIGCDKSATEVNIPAEIDGFPVTGIISNAFKECSNLTSIEIPDSVANIGNYAFSGCTELKKITLSNSVTSIEDGLFRECSNLTFIEIPDSIAIIGDYAFANCSGLTSINIPNSVTSIGDWAFHNCTGLKEITISNSVTSIGKFSFRECSSLTSIEIPDSVTSIGNDAFESCTGLTEIIIPDSVTNIGISAFYGCKSLTKITLPDSVTNINDCAFWNCTELKEITILNPNCEIYDNSFTITNGYRNNYFNGTIYGYSNSTAQAYAEKYGKKFVPLDNAPETGDANCDGKIDSSDASLILVEYSIVSTGGTGTFSESVKKLADVNKDGAIDSKDASAILTYYSYVSTGGKDSIETFLAKQ